MGQFNNTAQLLFTDNVKWRSGIKEIWYYYATSEETAVKIRIKRFDVNVGEIVLYQPDEQDAISIDIDEIPVISPEQVMDRPIAVFEVIADGYKNAYATVNIE